MQSVLNLNMEKLYTEKGFTNSIGEIVISFGVNSHFIRKGILFVLCEFILFRKLQLYKR